MGSQASRLQFAVSVAVQIAPDILHVAVRKQAGICAQTQQLGNSIKLVVFHDLSEK